jgi:hypothetical protein
MSISWIAPAALAGIAFIVLPIAVHLLVRQPVRQWPFPSLRFLQETQLAAFRRRSIRDAALLCCRIAIIALAAVALAGPVLRTDPRTAAFASRTSRAIVVLESADDAIVARVAQGAWKSATFRRADVRDAFADAIRWLNQQPPSAREIVVTGRLRRGSVDDGEVAQIPSDIGVAFEPIAFDSSMRAQLSILTRHGGHLGRIDRPVTFTADATAVVDGGFTPVADDLITINAAASDRELANAGLRAALNAGMAWSDFATPVVIVWEGGVVPSRAGARVVRMPAPQQKASAADAVMAALLEDASRPQLPEPLPISEEQLRAWTRSPGPVAPDAPLSDEGDRRWVWGAVLFALALEWWLRRPHATAAAVEEDARVA